MSKKSDAGAKDAVFQYLLRQNRPYSAVDVHNNLHKEYGKAAVTRALEDLAQERCLKEKTYGKQKVYVAEQSQFPEANETEIKEMESQIVVIQENLKRSLESGKKLDAEIRTVTNSLTTLEANAQLASAQSDIESFQKRLVSLKESNNSVSPHERKALMKSREMYIKEWRTRKRIANDILNSILEGYPKSKKELYEDIGIETDEDFKVKPPEI